MNVHFHTDGVLIETLRSKAGFDIKRSSAVQLPIQGVVDGIDFGDVLSKPMEFGAPS